MWGRRGVGPEATVLWQLPSVHVYVSGEYDPALGDQFRRILVYVGPYETSRPGEDPVFRDVRRFFRRDDANGSTGEPRLPLGSVRTVRACEGCPLRSVKVTRVKFSSLLASSEHPLLKDKDQAFGVDVVDR